MKYTRRYLQFNDLVFDGYDMIQDSDGGVDFKINSTEKSYGHGSYLPMKAEYLFAKEQSISMTVVLRMKKLRCDARPYYVDFVIGQISKPGKLWKVQNGEIMWAYAVVESYTPQDDARENQFSFDIDFLLPEGVWHKANKQMTFMVPYDICSFMECLNFRTVQPCSTGVCDTDHVQERKDNSCVCCCESLSKEMALCYNLDKITEFYSRCGAAYQLVYDCESSERLFGTIGHKMCVETWEDDIIAGTFYSETDIPTTGVDIIIEGKVHNPWVTINDNTNIIEGDYNGIHITESGDVYSVDGCCETLLDPAVWSVPKGSYGWTVKQGMNSVIVHLNACCSVACVYIREDALSL